MSKRKAQLALNKKKKRKYLISIALIVIVIITVIPLYLPIINSFKLTNDIVRSPFALPFNSFTLENYKNIFSNGNTEVFNMYLNSIILTGVSLLLIMVFSPLAGYYIARSTNIVAKNVTIYFLAGMMIAEQITLIPLAGMYRDLGLIGKMYGMFFFYLGNNCAFSIIFYSKFIRSIPYELEEAAVIDGASRFKIFWKVIYPLLKPCTATIIVFVGLTIWNDFLNPLILLGGAQSQTITLGIYSAIGPYGADFGLIFSYVVIASAPILILYIFMQKWFVSGLTAGAVKG